MALINYPLLPLCNNSGKLSMSVLSPLSEEVPDQKDILFGEYFDLYGAKKVRKVENDPKLS